MNILLFTINANYSTCPPLGLFNIAAYCQDKHPELQLVFSIKAFRSYKLLQIMKIVAKEKPDLIGIGVYVWNQPQVLELTEKIKALYPNISIVLGGPSVWFGDDEIVNLLKRKKIDYAIKGEGEKTFADLLSCIKSGDPEGLTKIPGLMGMDKQKNIFWNEQSRDHLLDINLLPNPYLVNPELLKQAKKDGVVYIETSRGCPYECGYCAVAKIPLRYKHLETVINEIKNIASSGLRKIVILDGTSNFNIARTKEMLRRIIDLGFDLELQFEIKAETLDDELIMLFKRVGVTFLEIGLQTSNEETLQEIGRHYNKEKFMTNIAKLIKHNHQFMVDLIIGLPGESIDDWFRSVDFCFDFGNIRFASMVLKILPNTMLFERYKEYGYEFDPKQINSILFSNTMSSAMIERAVKMNYILMHFWSLPGNEGLRPYIREICEKHYDHKLSLFLQDAYEHLRDHNLFEEIQNFNFEEKSELIAGIVDKE